MSTSLIPRPDLSALIPIVTDAVSSPHTKRAYGSALRKFLVWHQATEPGPFGRATVNAYRVHMEAIGLGRASINLALSALRKLAEEAGSGGMIPESTEASVRGIRGLPHRGARAGNWLTRQQAGQLLKEPDLASLSGLRDRALLSLLVGCGLRRSEAVALQLEQIQERDGHACIVDLRRKHGRVQIVPAPAWVRDDVDRWAQAAGITSGHVVRGFDKAGQVGGSISSSGIWWIVRQYAERLGFVGLAPHDLRRTWAKLALRGGADLRKIQQALGHSSVAVTERYVGSDVDLEHPACDQLGIDSGPGRATLPGEGTP